MFVCVVDSIASGGIYRVENYLSVRFNTYIVALLKMFKVRLPPHDDHDQRKLPHTYPKATYKECFFFVNRYINKKTRVIRCIRNT